MKKSPMQEHISRVEECANRQNLQKGIKEARTEELKSRPHLHSRFDLPRVSGLVCSKESYVQPQFKDECDIGNILEKFSLTGLLPQVSGGRSGDVSEVPDFQGLYELRDNIQEFYRGLPESVRGRFPDYDSFSAFVLNSTEEDILAAMSPPEAPSTDAGAGSGESAADEAAGKPTSGDALPTGGDK